MTTGLACADKLISFFDHIASAYGTFFFGRLLPGHEITFRIIFTSIILSSLFRFAEHNFFSALRTGNAYLFQIRLRISAFREARAGKETAMRTVFNHHMRFAEHNFFSALRTGNAYLFQIRLRISAFREARAGKETAMRTVFNHHMTTALLADLVCDLILNLNFLKLLLRCFHSLFQIRIKIFHNCLPVDGSLFHPVEKSFHICRKIRLYNARKCLQVLPYLP